MYGAGAPALGYRGMTDSTEIALGVLVLAVGLGVAGWTVVLTARFSRGGGAVESMLQRSFLPEKRRTYLSVLSIEGSFFLCSGLVWGLIEAGVLPESPTELLVGGLLIGGMACVGGITWLGLRPSRLTPHEQAALRNRALVSLVLAPMVAEARPPGSSRRDSFADR
jgi:hypothetical protein